MESFKNSDLYKNYLFNKEDDLDKIKIDISFLKSSKKTEEEGQDLLNGEDKNNNIVSKQSVSWTKNMLSTFPEIKPLIQVLKRFLKIKNFNSPHKGIKLFNLHYLPIITITNI